MKKHLNHKKPLTSRHNYICYDVEYGFADTFTIETRNKIKRNEIFEKSFGNYIIKLFFINNLSITYIYIINFNIT